MPSVQIEQYVHTLVAAEPDFVPKPIHVTQFIEALATSFGFRIHSDSQSCLKFRVMTSTGRRRLSTNQVTGVIWSYPVSDRVEAAGIGDIPHAIERLEDYRVFLSGEWEKGKPPLKLLIVDGTPFKGSYLCEVSCHLRPQPVPMSSVPTNSDPPKIDADHYFEETTQIFFSNPWTGAKMDVPSVSYARCWIEFEFGKFLLPKITDSLDILSPAIVARTEDCFQAKFVQGWTFR